MPSNPPSFSVNVPAPIGIAATPNKLLFSQPFCDTQTFGGSLVLRGVYDLIGPTRIVPLAPAIGGCDENYLAISPCLGGFAKGNIFVVNFPVAGTPSVFQTPPGGGAPIGELSDLSSVCPQPGSSRRLLTDQPWRSVTMPR